jgi:hypothetical protein
VRFWGVERRLHSRASNKNVVSRCVTAKTFQQLTSTPPMKAHTDRARKGAAPRRALAEGRHLGPGKRSPLHGGLHGSGLGGSSTGARERVGAVSVGNGESQRTNGASRGVATGMSEVRSFGTWWAENAHYSKAERSTEAVNAS